MKPKPVFSEAIELAVYAGALVVAGSRSIKNADWFGEKVYRISQERGWNIVVGDASGVDETVINYAGRFKDHRLIVLGCAAVGRIRLSLPDGAISQLIAGGDKRSSCYVIRDEAMATLAKNYALQSGFMALWDGQSKGTMHTANFCKQQGIAGIVFNQNNEVIMRWK